MPSRTETTPNAFAIQKDLAPEVVIRAAHAKAFDVATTLPRQRWKLSRGGHFSFMLIEHDKVPLWKHALLAPFRAFGFAADAILTTGYAGPKTAKARMDLFWDLKIPRDPGKVIEDVAKIRIAQVEEQREGFRRTEYPAQEEGEDLDSDLAAGIAEARNSLTFSVIPTAQGCEARLEWSGDEALAFTSQLHQWLLQASDAEIKREAAM